jgi:hypothetical protein
MMLGGHMPPAVYRDLAAFGLPFVTPDQRAFAELVRGILENDPGPMVPKPGDKLEPGAVLLNQSGKAIITLAWVWRCIRANRPPNTRRSCTLGSSMQMDVLAGRAHVDRSSFIRAGSKRLITPDGVFGDNFDVPPPASFRRSGFGIGGGGSAASLTDDVVRIELDLDVVVFEDGIVVGLDEFGMREGLIRGIELQRKTARDAAQALRNGSTLGQVFDIFQPLARRPPPAPGPSPRWSPEGALSLFVNMAIQQLVHGEREDLIEWFRKVAETEPLPLRAQPSE